MARLQPWQISLFFHVVLAGIFAVLTTITLPDTESFEVPVVFEPEEIQNLTEIKEEKPKVVLKSVNDAEEGKTSREVFGANRNSYTDDSVNDAEAVAAKKGNTLAKASDEKVLTDDDADVLPTPTEEYLVNEMPRVISEVRPEYPKEAREKKIEGRVILDILIDKEGRVRQATVVDGEEIFRKGALQAIKKFLFRPANVDGGPVAVKIRYTLNFELEY